MATVTNEYRPITSLELDNNLFDDEDDNDLASEENSLSNQKSKDSKNKRKRTKKKKPQKSFDTIASLIDTSEAAVKEKEAGDENADPDNTETIEIELVPEEIKLEKNFEEFSKIFDHFKVNFLYRVKQINSH